MSRILVWHNSRVAYTELSKQFLKDNFPNEDIFVTSNEKEAIANIADTEILLTTPYSRELVEKGTNIKWIQALSAGFNQFDIEYLKSRNIKLARVVGMHNSHMAELAIMAMITLTREMSMMFEEQSKHNWLQKINQERIYGKTLAIIGCGSIGLTIAQYAKAMGMHTIALNRKAIPTSEILDECYSVDEIESVLPKADMVLSILPGTPETKHFMTAERFALMKKSAYFINLGRGDAVATDVLIDVLSNNVIKGAFTDVAEKEPLLSDSPLWSVKNLIITPHIGGHYDDYLHGAFEFFIKNYELYTKGEELIARVDNL